MAAFKGTYSQTSVEGSVDFWQRLTARIPFGQCELFLHLRFPENEARRWAASDRSANRSERTALRTTDVVEQAGLPKTAFYSSCSGVAMEPPSPSIRDNASSSKRRSKRCLADFEATANVRPKAPAISRQIIFVLVVIAPHALSLMSTVGQEMNRRWSEVLTITDSATPKVREFGKGGSHTEGETATPGGSGHGCAHKHVRLEHDY